MRYPSVMKDINFFIISKKGPYFENPYLPNAVRLLQVTWFTGKAMNSNIYADLFRILENGRFWEMN